MRQVLDTVRTVIVCEVFNKLLDLPLNVPVIRDYGGGDGETYNGLVIRPNYTNGIEIVYDDHSPNKALSFEGVNDEFEFGLVIPYPFAPTSDRGVTFILKLYYPDVDGDILISYHMTEQQCPEWGNVRATLCKLFKDRCKPS